MRHQRLLMMDSKPSALSWGVASQCNILSVGDSKKYHDALLHVEQHIAKLERHVDAIESDDDNNEWKLKEERDLAARRFDELLRLCGMLITRWREELRK